MGEPLRVLDVGQQHGREFRHAGHSQGDFILCHHSGAGLVILQAQTPDGEWIDLGGDGGVEFSESGMQQFFGSSEITYRLRCDGPGSKAWLVAGLS